MTNMANLPRLMRICAYLLPPLFFLSHALADICCSLIAVLFLVDSFLRRDWNWVRQGWVKWGMVVWLYMIVRSLFVPEIALSLSLSLPFGRFILFAVGLQKIVLADDATSAQMLKILTVSVVVALAETLLQYAFGQGPVGYLLGHPYYHRGERMFGPMSAARIGIMLTFIGFIVMVPIITQAMVIGANNKARWERRKALIATLVSLMFVTTIFISGERMAFILTSIGYGLLSLVIWRTVGKWLALVGLLKTVAVISAFAVAGRQMVERQLISTWQTLVTFPTSSYGQLWLAGLAMGLQHPFFGIGPKQFAHYCPQYMQINAAEWCNLHAHNVYIEWFSELGLVGLVVLSIWMWREVLWVQLKHFPQLVSNPLWLGLIITLTLRLLPFTANTSFFKNWAAVPLWFVIGWLFAITDGLKRGRSK